MLPTAFLQRMQQMLGPEYPAFLRSYDRPRSVGLRFNPLKGADLPQLSFGLTPVPWAPHGYFYDPATRPGLHPYHEAGVYYLQEPSAMAPAVLLDAQPGELVLDLCAAPGGKSTQIAAALQGRGLLVCNEINPGRAKILARNIERLGITNALVLQETPQRIAAAFPHCFDRVLVDAPCSGEGMFRKEAAASADWSEATVAHCAARQQEILDAAAVLLKAGGRLVYSTCTFAPAENEGAIAAFLHRHPDFALEAPGEAARFFAPGNPDWAEGQDPTLAKTCRLWPHELPCEGHFAAVLRYCGDAENAWQPVRPVQVPAVWRAFADECLPDAPEGVLISFGDTLYAAPPVLPQLEGLRVLRAGLELGQMRKGRFVPAHALALASRDAAACCRLEPDDPRLAQYLEGQQIPGDACGWTLVFAGPYPIGWAKGSGGVLKNHFPKGLRHLPGAAGG